MLRNIAAQFLHLMAGPHYRIRALTLCLFARFAQHNGSRRSLIALLLGNHFALQHALQRFCFHLAGAGHTAHRVEERRCSHETGERSAFYQVQFTHFLAEVVTRSRLDTVTILPVIDAAKVLLQNGILIELIFYSKCQHCLEQLTVHRLAAQLENIAGKLHGDGRGPLLVAHGHDITHHGAQHRGNHHTAVVEERFILASHKGIHQMFRQLIARNEAFILIGNGSYRAIGSIVEHAHPQAGRNAVQIVLVCPVGVHPQHAGYGNHQQTKQRTEHNQLLLADCQQAVPALAAVWCGDE